MEKTFDELMRSSYETVGLAVSPAPERSAPNLPWSAHRQTQAGAV